MTAVGVTPCGPVVAEDVRDLQSWPGQGNRVLRRSALPRQGQMVERTGDRSQQIGGDLGIARGRIELGVSERTRVIMHLLLTH